MTGKILDEKKAAGNWKKFSYFAWSRQWDLPDPDNWFIFYTHSRDSALLEQSNAKEWADILKPYLEEDKEDPDIYPEDHRHWACGWVKGYAVRVLDASGEVTPVFQKVAETMEALADYLVLNDETYSALEAEATLSNIEEVGERVAFAHEVTLPDDWVSEAHEWLRSNNERALENLYDRGGCPSDEDMLEAFNGLGYERAPLYDEKM